MKRSSLSIKKIKETTSRTSLTIVFAVFVFTILVSAIAIAAFGFWILTKLNVIVDIDGELQLGKVTLFMTIISLIIGGVISFFASRIPLRPVNKIINKMNRLAAGDFESQLTVESNDEIGILTTTFNDETAMFSNPAIKEFAECFNKMAEELENTELLRNDFINNFSHEFKTPIVSITGLANLLESGNLTEEQRVQYARAIREESMRLSSMASNILNLSKIENQTILTDVTEFNVSEQIRSAVLLLEEKWNAKNIELQIELEEYVIEANEELLKQVWINLMDNAVKFAPNEGMVALSIDDKGDALCIIVSNTGCDIPYDKQEKIFNKFYQADESHATKGNGIGLAIVKGIVDLHHGTVEVKSENGLTTFSVMLPKKQ